MRNLILAGVLALGFCGASFGAAGEAAATAPGPAASNTTCAACDKAVDPKKDKVVVAKATDGKQVALACCCDKCAEKVEKEPAKFADKAEKPAVDTK